MRNPLPDSEVKICERVRLVREAARVSRPIFGRFLSLDSSKLANIEHHRVPVDYITGVSLCRIFRVSAGWLVDGTGRPTQVLPDSVFAPALGVSGRTLFSEAYSSFLRDRIRLAEAELATQTREIDRMIAERAADEDLASSPVDFERAYQEATVAAGASERAEIDAILSRAVYGSPLNVAFENELAIVTGFDDIHRPMRAVVAPADLIDQVKNLTIARGAKAALAERLQVSRQRLNEWLSGRSKPNAHYTLKLLAQLQTLKRRASARGTTPPETKRAASASTEAALKTRKSKSTTNEKAESDQKIIRKK